MVGMASRQSERQREGGGMSKPSLDEMKLLNATMLPEQIHPCRIPRRSPLPRSSSRTVSTMSNPPQITAAEMAEWIAKKCRSETLNPPVQPQATMTADTEQLETALRALPSGNVRFMAARILENEVPHARVTRDQAERKVTMETDEVTITITDKTKP